MAVTLDKTDMPLRTEIRITSNFVYGIRLVL